MNDIFQRVEQKYVISKKKKELLLNEINNYIEKDEYYQSNIYNIYFDNDKNDLIINSLEKPKFKVKIRLRSYNIPDLDDNVYLEIKDKYDGIVGKRRIKIKLKDFYNYLNSGLYNDSQIMRELDYYFKLFNLEPSIYVSYSRLSYKEINNKNLRITFDYNLKSRMNDLKLELGNYGEEYFDNDNYILEIKTLDSMPIWLVSALSKLKIYPTSFSKVGSIYEKKKRSDFVC